MGAGAPKIKTVMSIARNLNRFQVPDIEQLLHEDVVLAALEALVVPIPQAVDIRVAVFAFELELNVRVRSGKGHVGCLNGNLVFGSPFFMQGRAARTRIGRATVAGLSSSLERKDLRSCTTNRNCLCPRSEDIVVALGSDQVLLADRAPKVVALAGLVGPSPASVAGESVLEIDFHAWHGLAVVGQNLDDQFRFGPLLDFEIQVSVFISRIHGHLAWVKLVAMFFDGDSV